MLGQVNCQKRKPSGCCPNVRSDEDSDMINGWKGNEAHNVNQQEKGQHTDGRVKVKDKPKVSLQVSI